MAAVVVAEPRVQAGLQEPVEEQVLEMVDRDKDLMRVEMLVLRI
jgi:hypothetical protein